MNIENCAVCMAQEGCSADNHLPACPKNIPTQREWDGLEATVVAGFGHCSTCTRGRGTETEAVVVMSHPADDGRCLKVCYCCIRRIAAVVPF